MNYPDHTQLMSLLDATNAILELLTALRLPARASQSGDQQFATSPEIALYASQALEVLCDHEEGLGAVQAALESTPTKDAEATKVAIRNELELAFGQPNAEREEDWEDEVRLAMYYDPDPVDLDSSPRP